MIKISNLSHRYYTGVTAVKNIKLEIKKGEKVGIIGQNGAGKTTLIKHLNGLLKPTKGKVIVNDIDTTGVAISDMAKTVGYVFQNPSDQIFNTTIANEVAFGLKQQKLSKNEIKKRVKSVLERVGLWNKRRTQPTNLNYSEKKMLTIASVLAMCPETIILDEPTTGQDYNGKKRIEKIIKTLKKETVIIVSHDMEFIARTVNRLIVMGDAKILADDNVRKVFQKKDILKKAFVEAPEPMRISKKLGLKPCLTVEECLEELKLH